MLVLSRKPGERITITGPCELHVLESDRSGRMKLGFIAPPTTIIRREGPNDRLTVGPDDRDAAHNASAAERAKRLRTAL